MLDKDITKLGESFARLLASPDYKDLQKYVQSEIQTISTELLQPKPPKITIEEWAINSTSLQGQLMGLAMPDAYIDGVTKRMHTIQKRKKEEEKLA